MIGRVNTILFKVVQCQHQEFFVISIPAEVGSGYVDTSVAGFVRNLERYEAVDFTQGIFKAVETFMIKTPKKIDRISFSSRKLIEQ